MNHVGTSYRGEFRAQPNKVMLSRERVEEGFPPTHIDVSFPKAGQNMKLSPLIATKVVHIKESYVLFVKLREPIKCSYNDLVEK